jgi:hypothetical protein
LVHWKREFQAWTDLNAIVYYGSAEDRKNLRHHEFAYPSDRPVRPVGMKQHYLKKCGSVNYTKADWPWMVDVVLTTPEMMIADDSIELTAVEWECLVVDEVRVIWMECDSACDNNLSMYADAFAPFRLIA